MLPATYWDITYVAGNIRTEEHTSELQPRGHLVCRLLLEKKSCSAPATDPTPASPRPAAVSGAPRAQARALTRIERAVNGPEQCGYLFVFLLEIDRPHPGPPPPPPPAALPR